MNRILLLVAVLFGTLSYGQIQEVEQSLRYQENKGQVIDTDGNLRPDILFTAESNGVKAYLRETGISYVFAHVNAQELALKSSMEDIQNYYSKIEEGQLVNFHRVDVEFIGANKNAQRVTGAKYDSYSNFYLGHCQDGVGQVSSFETVKYLDIYPNIDLVFYTSTGHLKYDFIVHPGGNPADIKIGLDGMDEAALNGDGDLVLSTTMGTIIEEAPYSFQSEGHEVESNFRLDGDALSFNLGEYDQAKDLTIDPEWLWSSYYGGSQSEDGYGKKVAVDGSGNIFIHGRTYSTDFPVSAGAYDAVYNNSDNTVSMFDADGNQIWATYLGGTGSEEAWGAAVDLSGNIVVSGNTTSSDFPTTAGAYDETFNGNWDNFVANFDNTGALVWSTLIGGTSTDYWPAVDIDGSGNIGIGACTYNGSYPTTAGAFDETANGVYDLTLAMLSSDGSTLIWSTYLGGSSDDYGRPGVKFDSNDDLYIVGCSYSTNYPTTAGAFDETSNGSYDWVLTKMDNAGAMIWSTYVGGSSDEGITVQPDVTVDGTDDVYIAGECYSTNMPSTTGAFAETSNGGYEIFFTKFNSLGAQVWGTYYGGSYDEYFGDLDYANGKVYMVFGAYQSSTGLTVTGDAHQATNAGDWDNFVSEWDTDGNLTYASWYGGVGFDHPQYNPCAYGGGQLTFIGWSSYDGYPTSTGAFQESYLCCGYDLTINTFRFCDIQLTVDAAIDVLCNGETTGSIDLTTTTTTESPVTYLWTGGATTEDISGLPAGDYDLVATGGATGCTVDLQTITIAEPDTMSATLTGVDPLCFGLSTGTIDLTPGGGVPAYTFAWTGGSTSEDPSSLAGGMYVVTITDDNGCVFEDSLMINEPTDIDAAFIITDVLCNGGADGDIDMTTSGGTPGYTYDWNTSETTEDITGLVAGDYTVLITDANGCIAFKGTTVGEPDEILLDLHTTDVACHGDSTGAIDLTVIGGTPTFTYTWDNGETTEDLADLTAGWYIIDLVDANGCTAMDSAEVMQADSLELSGFTVMETVGFDGEAHASVFGGTAPYTYDWDNGATTPDIFGLVAGDYVLTVTDANGCIVVMTFTVTSQVGIETSSINGLDVYPNPFNESFNINYNGNYDYSIYDAAGKLIQVGNGNGQSVIDLDEVEAGMYILQIATSTGMDNIQLIKQ